MSKFIVVKSMLYAVGLILVAGSSATVYAAVIERKAAARIVNPQEGFVEPMSFEAADGNMHEVKGTKTQQEWQVTLFGSTNGDILRSYVPKASVDGNGEFVAHDYSAGGRLQMIVSLYDSSIYGYQDYGSPRAVEKKVNGSYSFDHVAIGSNTGVRIRFVVNPFIDTDGDKVSDLIEFNEGSNPNDAQSFLDTDGDGIADAIDDDIDGNGVDNLIETDGLDPYADADYDGIPAYLDPNPNESGDPVVTAWNPDFVLREGLPPYFRMSNITSRQDVDDPVVLYVKPGSQGSGLSWNQAFGRIETAAAVSLLPGDEIWLAAGNYAPIDVANGFQFQDGVTVRGGFAGEQTETDASDALPKQFVTILSGDRDRNDDKVLGVVQDPIADINGSNNETVVTFPSHGSANRTTLTGVTITASSKHGVRIEGDARVQLSHVIVKGNLGEYGAGIYIKENADVVINDADVVNNAAVGGWGRGGGITVIGRAHAVINRTLIANNQSASNSAAILIESDSSGYSPSVVMANSTVTGNIAGSSPISIRNSGTLSCVHCSIINNAASSVNIGKNIYVASNATLNLERSIVANTDRLEEGAWDIYNDGTVNNGGYNIIGSDGVAGLHDSGEHGCRYANNNYPIPGVTAACTGEKGLMPYFFTSTPASVVGTQLINEMLNPTLSNNGGQTKTLPLRYGSSLIDFVPNEACGNDAFFGVGNVDPITIDNATDQRGFTRQFGVGCDVGAFEYTDNDGICYDDGALARSKGTNSTSNVFCAGSEGGTLAEFLNNAQFGSSSPLFLLLLSLGFVCRVAKKRLMTKGSASDKKVA